MLASSPAQVGSMEREMWRTWFASFFYDASTLATSGEAASTAEMSSPAKSGGLRVRTCDSPPTPATGGMMRRTWSAADSSRLSELEDSPSSPSAVERVYCEQRRQTIERMSSTAQALVQELFTIITGEDDFADIPDDVTLLENNPGYEKPSEQRRLDCARVATILSSGVPGVHANLTWSYGETLLWMAVEYDHRHPPEMIDVLLAAGADPNGPNAIDGLRPLQNPWLSEDDEMADEGEACAAFIAQKRQRLCAAGADNTLCRPSDEHSARGCQSQRKRALSLSSETSLFSRSRSSLW